MVKAGSSDPKVYGPQLFKSDYQGVTTKIGFESDGELKNPAMTLYVYKDGKKVPLN
jgi:branched-chain amino acid transport system substrate-binding protein